MIILYENNFQEQYLESIKQIENDIAALKRKFPDTIKITKTSVSDDKAGTDYQILLKSGELQRIDVKRRTFGASCYWEEFDNPDIPLEIWSVITTKRKKIGWTLADSTADYILFLFELEDTPCEILLPFKLLKMIFYYHGREWAEKYGIKIQKNTDKYGNKWNSAVVFVPVIEIKEKVINLLFPFVGSSTLSMQL